MYDAEHLCIARQCVNEYSEKNGWACGTTLCDQILCALKETPNETTTLLKEAFGKEALGDLTIQRWHKAFVDGRKSAELELQTVVMATNIDTIAAIIEEDQHLTIRALAEALYIPRDTESEDNESVMGDE